MIQKLKLKRKIAVCLCLSVCFSLTTIVHVHAKGKDDLRKIQFQICRIYALLAYDGEEWTKIDNLVKWSYPLLVHEIFGFCYGILATSGFFLGKQTSGKYCRYKLRRLLLDSVMAKFTRRKTLPTSIQPSGYDQNAPIGITFKWWGQLTTAPSATREIGARK